MRFDDLFLHAAAPFSYIEWWYKSRRLSNRIYTLICRLDACIDWVRREFVCVCVIFVRPATFCDRQITISMWTLGICLWTKIT